MQTVPELLLWTTGMVAAATAVITTPHAYVPLAARDITPQGTSTSSFLTAPSFNH